MWFIVISTIIFIIFYQCVVKYWSFFSSRKVKYLRGFPVLGTNYKMILGLKCSTSQFEFVYNKYPNEKVVGLYELGGTPVFLIRDPELVKQVTIKDFDHFANHRNIVKEDTDPILGRTMFILRDQEWRDSRRTLTPAFTGSKMKLFSNLIAESAEEFCEFLKKDLKNQTLVYNSLDLFRRFACDAIANCAFGLKTNSLENANNTFYERSLSITKLDGMQGLKFFAYASIPRIMNFFKIKFFNNKDVNYFRNVVHSNIHHRETHNIFRPDMIDMLLKAKREEQHAVQTEIDVGESSKQLKKWDDDYYTAQCVLFLIGGLQTTSGAHCFLAHELAMNPKIQERLYQEILDVCSQLNGNAPCYETLQKMTFMEMVVSEVLRRWTLAPFVDRMVTKPYVLDDMNGNKIQLNVGDGIILPLGAIHMDSKYFPDPTRFDPERFSKENISKVQSSTYLPFGVGQRNCIGAKFSILEMKLLFFYLLKHFVIEQTQKTQLSFELKRNTAAVALNNGFWIQLKRRQ